MKILILATAALVLSTAATAQNTTVDDNRQVTSANDPALTVGDKVEPRRNFKNEVKLNLPSLALGNISLQYERAFTRQFSGAFGFRVGPEQALPFASQAKSIFKDDSVAKKMLEGARLSNYALTPEVRYYFGKGVMSGFYLGLFGRFGKFSLTDLPFTLNDPSFANGSQEILLKGGYSYGGGGFQMGAKFNVSPRVSIDWFFFGPMISYGNVELEATGDFSNLTASGKQDAIEELAGTFANVTISDNNIRVTQSLPVPGVRTGLTLGFRF